MHASFAYPVLRGRGTAFLFALIAVKAETRVTKKPVVRLNVTKPAIFTHIHEGSRHQQPVLGANDSVVYKKRGGLSDLVPQLTVRNIQHSLTMLTGYSNLSRSPCTCCIEVKNEQHP